MRPATLSALLTGLLVASGAAIADDRPSYRVLGADKGKVAIVAADGAVEWEVANPVEVHALALLPNGNVLFSTKGPAIVEMTPAKEVVWKYECRPTAENKQRVEVHAFQRLADG